MATAMDPKGLRLVAVGMNGGALSSDDGATWRDLRLPAGSSALSYGPDGTLYSAALDGERARIFSSNDNGDSWNQLN